MKLKIVVITSNPGTGGPGSSFFTVTVVGTFDCEIIGEVSVTIGSVMVSEVGVVVFTNVVEGVNAIGVIGMTNGASCKSNGGGVVKLPGGGRSTRFTGLILGLIVSGWVIGIREGPVVVPRETGSIVLGS